MEPLLPDSDFSLNDQAKKGDCHQDFWRNSLAGAHSNIIRLGLRFPGTSRFRESDLEKRHGRVGRVAAVSPRTAWRNGESSFCASENSTPSQALVEVKMAKLFLFLPSGVGATEMATSTWESRVPSPSPA